MFNLDQIKKLADKYGINAFYLFGSFADGSFNEDSDIDLAYLSDVKGITIDNGLLYFDIREFITREIDLVDIRRASLSFAFHIIKEGKVIYERDKEKRTDFEDELIRNYLDFNVYNRVMDEEITGNFGLGRTLDVDSH